MLNIVVPMAGRGSRFASEGFQEPKPLIPIKGQPMIKLVIENLTPISSHKFFFVAQNEHIQQYSLREKLTAWAPDCEVIGVDQVTLGPAATVLEARPFIDNDLPLMIANSDQWIEANINNFLKFLDSSDIDGSILTMVANDSKWSFVRTNANGIAVEVAEKKVISNEATIGIYGFRRGSDFVEAADKMIADGLLVNGEAYVAPAYNLLIQRGLRITTSNIGSEGRGMHGLGTPSDLKAFLDKNIF